ncbi:paraquat-inducible protein A [uncultured Psychrosphaera sp.]|uniref:paraquat-inducible protein A n=1 Tax=uncultured Psychrosphaera sp. TaxID=1403522 RepID=UPI00261302A6|nr:paraquat-inducible protein A [uncultured Psychrosphaera sp.]
MTTNFLPTNNSFIISCEECGLVVSVSKLEEGQKAHCPRCDHTLTKKIGHPKQKTLAYALTCLIMLFLSLSFPFMSFSFQGLTQEITLLNAVNMLEQYQNSLLALLLLTTVIILPTIYMSLVLYLYVAASKKQTGSKRIIFLCKLLFKIKPWLMVDVFLLGVLVSLIKISSLADVSLGPSFFTFCLYAVLVVKCVSLVDRSWLWEQFIPIQQFKKKYQGETQHANDHLSCHVCHQINPISEETIPICIRCHSSLRYFDMNKNLQQVWALLLTAIIFYIPANVYPIMYTVSLGSTEPSTIIEGVILLWQLGSYPIATVIFIASVFIPLVKILALCWLLITAKKVRNLPDKNAIQKLKVYRVTEFIGRWSMIDVFVVAILVALIQLKSLMAIYPGPGALSFAIVVIFTMLAAMRFDSRMLWRDPKYT